MKFNFSILFIFFFGNLLAQAPQPVSEEIKINEYVTGTLLTPAEAEATRLVILIPGSGPTDRNGNLPFMKNDALKKIAAGLAEKGIASFRYDKRVLNKKLKDADIRFEDFVADAETSIEYFKNKDLFDKVIMLGHSQGSLVGMLAAQNNADAFISVAGAGQPIDSVITQQVAAQMPGLKVDIERSFKEIRETGSSTDFNPVLQSILDPSLQPFLRSWMLYDPREEIKELQIPVLIIAGTTDIQVPVEEAEMLYEAIPSAEIVVIEGMNHVLKEIKGDSLENSKSYNQPGLPLHPELLSTIIQFIQNL